MKNAIIFLMLLTIIAGCSTKTTTTQQTTTQEITTTTFPTTIATTTESTRTMEPTTRLATTTNLATTQETTTSQATSTTAASDEFLIISYDAGKAAVEVNTIPDKAEVWVNNEYWGYSPKTKEIIPGTIRVNFKKMGATSYTKSFELKAGEKAVFNVDLGASATMASIFVDSIPQGSQITIDGRSYGLTPKKVDNIRIANLNVKIVKAGYRDYNKYLSIYGDMVINETLVPLN